MTDTIGDDCKKDSELESNLGKMEDLSQLESFLCTAALTLAMTVMTAKLSSVK